MLTQWPAKEFRLYSESLYSEILCAVCGVAVVRLLLRRPGILLWRVRQISEDSTWPSNGGRWPTLVKNLPYT